VVGLGFSQPLMASTSTRPAYVIAHASAARQKWPTNVPAHRKTKLPEAKLSSKYLIVTIIKANFP
jgi:hypothetical protein